MAVYQILVCYFTAREHLYMDYKNDISFLIDSTLNLYEHQSTWNPNMPLRGLGYFARLYEDYVRLNELNIYSETRIKMPKPQYFVFYNGTKAEPDRQILKLSDSFNRFMIMPFLWIRSEDILIRGT